MKFKCKTRWFVYVAFLFSVLFAVSAGDAYSQDAKPDPSVKEKKQKPENDDDVSREEARNVKVSLEAARAVALGKIAGKVIEEELERERGRLQYAFDIIDANGDIFDIEVDAETGEVLQVEREDEDDDDDGASAKVKKKKKVKTLEKTAKVVKTKSN